MLANAQGSDSFFIESNIEQTAANYFICLYFLITHKPPRLDAQCLITHYITRTSPLSKEKYMLLLLK